MSGRVRNNNNQFWQSARHLHLDSFIESLYKSNSKKALIEKWLRGKVKWILIRQKDFLSDPLLIEFRPDSFGIMLVENGERAADVEIEATHTAIICYSTEFIPCVRAWLRGEIKAPKLFSKTADHYYAARIFLEEV